MRGVRRYVMYSTKIQGKKKKVQVSKKLRVKLSKKLRVKFFFFFFSTSFRSALVSVGIHAHDLLVFDKSFTRKTSIREINPIDRRHRRR